MLATTLGTIGHFLMLVLGFGLVIIVHELGHFLVAKVVGIRVDQFAVGFGPAVFSWRKGIGLRSGTTTPEYERRLAEGTDPSALGETEYRLNWLPLGGYVKMLGQEDVGVAVATNDPRSYQSRPVWARMAVVSAGVIMNVIFAVILFVICFLWGVKMAPPVVGGVAPGSDAVWVMPTNAEEAGVTEPGIRPGDRVLAVNGDDARSFPDVQTAVAMALSGKPVRLDVQRGDQVLRFDIEPRMSEDTELLDLGLFPTSSAVLAKFEKPEDFENVLRHSGLDGLGLEPGMRLLTINGEPVEALWQLSLAIDESNGEPLHLTFGRGDEVVAEATVTPEPDFLPALIAHGAGPVSVEQWLGLTPTVRIDPIEGSNAEEAGLRSGDVIRRVAGILWPRMDHLIAAINASAGGTLPMQVVRDGETVDVEVPVGSDGRVGFRLVPDTESARVAMPMAESVDLDGEGTVVHPAASLNLLPGSIVEAVDGHPVSRWSDFQRAIKAVAANADGDATVELTVRLPLPGEPVETLEWTIPAEALAAVREAGWHSRIRVDLFEPARTTLKAANPIEALQLGFHETWRMMYMTYLTIDRLFRGTVKVEQLKGPVGIAEIGTRVAGQGMPYLIMFLAIISVNLAVLNFLPIPIVDGGLFVFLLIEKIKGSPVSERVQGAATTVGLLLLGTLFLVTFYNDVMNLLRNMAS